MNCFICGQSDRQVDLVKVSDLTSGGLSVNGVHIPDREFICVDVDDCELELEAKLECERHDYPEDVDDTPCLDSPWWANR